jgi:hypothetical protein
MLNIVEESKVKLKKLSQVAFLWILIQIDTLDSELQNS